MGAFDGYKVPYDTGYPTTDFSNNYSYFPNQPAFRFFKGFGFKELKELLEIAKHSDTVYVPQERPGNGRIALNTWYVKALIQKHCKQT